MLTKELDRDYSIIRLSREQSSDVSCDLSHKVPELDSVPDYILHTAGIAHLYPKSDFEKQLFYGVNYQGTKNLLNALDNTIVKPKGLIFISSVAVYGLTSGSKYLRVS